MLVRKPLIPLRPAIYKVNKQEKVDKNTQSWV